MRLGVGLAPVALALATSSLAGTPPAQPTLAVAVAQPGSASPHTPDMVTGVGANARSAGLVVGPEVSALPITKEAATRSVTAFALSCPALLRRDDTSGLTVQEDWAPACAAASASPDPVAFLRQYFETAQVGPGTAFATGYYEPEILGSRTRDAAHQVPIYGKPTDLVELDLGRFSDSLKGKRIVGRIEGQIGGGGFVPYFDRPAIEAGGLTGRATEIAWAADPIEFFFLQVQGSGRLRLPDGSVMRIGYAAQNGRDYTGIGVLMRDRGLIVPGQLSMQGIIGWLRAHPDQAPAILDENKSWVFFRELIGPGPIGAMSTPVTPGATVAADPAFVPLGAPVWLDLDRPEATGLWVAQDTGGAIKGANRFDTFWGAGDEARRIAGGMSGRGRALILVPRGTLARLAAASTANGAAPQR